MIFKNHFDKTSGLVVVCKAWFLLVSVINVWPWIYSVSSAKSLYLQCMVMIMILVTASSTDVSLANAFLSLLSLNNQLPSHIYRTTFFLHYVKKSSDFYHYIVSKLSTVNTIRTRMRLNYKSVYYCLMVCRG